MAGFYPVRGGWDVLINSEPYLFWPKGGLRLGFGPKAPPGNARVDSIVIPSFHHGFGQRISVDPAKYFYSENVNPSLEGRLLPVAADTSAVTAGCFTQGVMRGGIYYDSIEEKCLIVTERKVFEVAVGVAAPTEIVNTGRAFAATEVLRGGAFRWHEDWIVGSLETAGTLPFSTLGFGRIDMAANTFVMDAQGTDNDAHSIGASSRGRAIWAKVKTAAPIEYWWTLDADNEFDVTTGLQTFGPFYDVPYPRPNWISMVGSVALIIREDGSILGIDETTGSLTVVGEVHTARPIAAPTSTLLNIGFHAKHYLNSLVFWAPGGFYSIDLSSFTITNINPYVVQAAMRYDMNNHSGENYGGAENSGAIAVRGDELYLIMAQSDDVTVFRGQQYRDGYYFSILHKSSLGTANDKEIHDAIVVRDTLGIVWRDGSTDGMGLSWINLPPPDYQSIGFGAATGKLRTSAYSGDGASVGAQKRFYQTRVWSKDADFWTLKFSVDDAATVSLGALAVGLNRITFPTTAAALGKNIAFEFSHANGAGSSRHIELPMFVDYLWYPEADEVITVSVTASDDTQERYSPRKMVDNLLALRHTITTIKFADDTEWNVFVEDVSAEVDVELAGRTGDRNWVAHVSVRRL